MLRIVVPKAELFDEKTNGFVNIDEQELLLEHSLLSISKWEMKWKIPFLGPSEKTQEQQLDYVRCMTITKGVKPETYLGLTQDNLIKIKEYIEDPMTATTFNEKLKGKPNHHVVTSEEIYYQLAANQIPFEVERWPLNRLMVLLRVFAVKSKPPKKMSKKAWANQQRSLNAARRAKLGTLG